MRSHLKLKASLLAATVLTTAVCLHADEATTRPAPDPTREPPAEFVLETPAGPIEVVAGEPFDLTVAGQTVRATLRPADTKRLDVGDVAFRYPVNMAFDYELDDWGDPCWTLDGSDVILTLNRWTDGADPAVAAGEMLDGLLEFYDGDARRQDGTFLKLGDQTVKGQRLAAELVEGVPIIQEAFGVKVGGRTYVLLLQDSPDAPAETTAEMKRVRQLLVETWTHTGEASE